MEPRETPHDDHDRRDERDDERLWKLLDHHPRLKSDPGFARRVARAAALEEDTALEHDADLHASPSASPSPRGKPHTLRRPLLFVAGGLAAAALLLFWIWSANGSDGAGAANPSDASIAARLDAPPEELLRELELLRDLDLLEGEGAARDFAVLLDVSDLELLDRARALWEEEAAGGD